MVHLLKVADGAIAGTWLREDGVVANAVDGERIRRLVRVAGKLHHSIK